jgi:hypothetical protein
MNGYEDFVTFLEYFSKFFSIRNETEEELYRVGPTFVRREEFTRTLRVLNRAKIKVDSSDKVESIDRLMYYAEKSYPDGIYISSHEEYSRIFSDFCKVYLSLREHSGVSENPVLKRLISSIYVAGSEREIDMYKFENSKNQVQFQ